MTKNLAVLDAVWFTKKRKAMLAILAAFIAGSSVYKVAARGTEEVQLSRSTTGTYVKAGGWICPDAMGAVNLATLKRSPAWSTMTQTQNNIGGCMETGRDLKVRVLDDTRIGNVEVVKAGNSGGTFWVLPDDLER